MSATPRVDIFALFLLIDVYLYRKSLFNIMMRFYKYFMLINCSGNILYLVTININNNIKVIFISIIYIYIYV